MYASFTGVPISTQWGAHGYFYPIQIAQYGLSHFSKFLVEKPRTSEVVEDAEDDDVSDQWSVVGDRGTVTSVMDAHRHTHVIEFDTSGSSQAVVDRHLQLAKVEFAVRVAQAIWRCGSSITTPWLGSRSCSHCRKLRINFTLCSRKHFRLATFANLYWVYF